MKRYDPYWPAETMEEAESDDGEYVLHEDAIKMIHEAIGCTYASCCTYGDKLQVTEFPEIAEGVLKALGINKEDS